MTSTVPSASAARDAPHCADGDRLATAVDLAALPEIERAAGELFRALAMDEIADDDPPTIAELAAAPAVWVATVDEVVAGYARVELVDGHAHLEQVSVHPDHGGRGIGTALLDAVADWARARGDAEVTLTTFADVALQRAAVRQARVRERPRGRLDP